jgi:site-specific DNA-methyltransferase (adenine-specific)
MKIGNGEFWLGDCLDLLSAVPDGSVDCVVTDPPYKVISGGTSSKLAAGWKTSVLSKNDGKIFTHNEINFDDYLPVLHRVLKPASHLYLMTNNLNLRDALNAVEEHGFHFHNLLRWDKNNKTANRWYMKDCEYTIFAAKRPVKPINDMSSSQGFKFDNPRNKRHPTEKPAELMCHYIENSTDVGDLVLDPFGGSGTTAVAAERTGRRWLSIERDQAYYYPAVGRVWSEINA